MAGDAAVERILKLEAAFEKVSTMTFRPHNRESFVDYRLTRLPSERLAVDDYDPREHRAPKQPINAWMAYYNVLRTLFGAGVLGMPLAISQTGMILGPILTIFTGILIIHTHLLLLRCLNEISRQLKIPYISYRYGFRLALLHGPPTCQWIGRKGPQIIATFMIMSQLGICVVFVILTTDSLRDIMDWETSKPAILTLIVPYLLLEYFMKTLKIVSYISLCGNILNTLGLILAFYHIFKYPPQGEVILATTDAIALSFAFGIFMFNLSAVGVILAMDKSLANPKVMTNKYGVINVGILTPTIVAMFFGVFGYWSFGTMEENVLRSLPYDDYSAMVCIGFYLIAVAFAFPIQCYPGVQVIREVVEYHDMYTTVSEATLKRVEAIARPAFVLMAFFICYFIPFQGPVIAFVGNLCTTLLALVFPATMDICLRYPDRYGPHRIILFKNAAIVIFGLIAWIVGVILCAYLIYIRILLMNSPIFSDFVR